MSYKEHLCSLRPLTPRERMWIENFHAHETPANLELTDDFLDLLNPGEKGLELGCAFGRVANYLSIKRGVFVMGVDINEAEIDDAKANCARLNDRTSFAVMNAAELSFPENEFDFVAMTGLIGGVELEERKNILKEAYRVVKRGGKVTVAEFKLNEDDPEKRKKYQADFEATDKKEWGTKIIWKGKKKLLIVKHFTEDELKKLLSETGFTSIQSREHEIKSKGVGDGIEETRRQYTVWGIKPKSLL